MPTFAQAGITILETLEPWWAPLTLLLLVAGFGLTLWQLHALIRTHADNHEWHRRKAAQDCSESFKERVPNAELLHEHLEYLTRSKPISDEEIAKIEQHPQLADACHSMLNYLEALARGISQKVFDERVVKSAKLAMMTRAYKIFTPYIEHRRKKLGHTTYWEELERLVKKWEYKASAKPLREATGFLRRLLRRQES